VQSRAGRSYESRTYAANDAVWLGAGTSKAVQEDQARRDREGGQAHEFAASSQMMAF